MNKKILLIIFIAIFLFGCAVRPTLTPEQIKNADYGPYPINYEQLIKDYFSNILFDPYSAVYTFSTPNKYYTGSTFGWRVCGTINAKNRMGGYTGAEKFYVLFKNDKIEMATTHALAVCP